MVNKNLNSISLIVPVYNEEANIVPLVKRINSVLVKAKINYEIIFVDDNSTDKTSLLIKEIVKFSPVIYVKKRGKRGKAYSIIEGIEFAKFDTIGMIDGDLQYPPEALPEMIKILETSDVVVTNRKNYQDSIHRKVLSNTFRFVFGRLLFGLRNDIQSGFKIFTREVIETIKFTPSSSWTFDLEFLHRATQAGFIIENFDITFSKRKNGNSKVGFVRQTIEIGSNALVVKAKRINPVNIKPENTDSMMGAGIGHKKRKYITHTTIPHHLSALTTFTKTQKMIIALILFILLAGIYLTPLVTLKILVAVLSSIYFADVVFNLYLISKSLRKSREIISTPHEIAQISDGELPIYSILCPLYKEAPIIPQFLKAIGDLSWPKDKLDVILLLEEDDKETIRVATEMNLPSYVRIVVVPHSIPKTKPKACNYGLAFVKGEYVVIYDAEDIPDSDQLKKAYLGFKKSPENVICLQAKLNYYNPHQNLLTRFFTTEYSLWFDVTLPGLVAMDTALPLGGTSNHFKTTSLTSVHGWDPFNVTEDADLGIRLFKKGYKTAMIDSTTLEEANSNVRNWFRQRSRWIKGYMQTYLIHTRNSDKTNKLDRRHSIYFQLVIGGKIAFVLINPLLWIATISYFALYAYVGPTIEALYPNVIFYMAIISLVLGNFLFLYYYMIALAKKGQWNLIKFVFLIPIYWFMISISAFIALYQLIFKPHYWEKTVHGLHLQKAEVKKEEEAVVPTPQISVVPIVPNVTYAGVETSGRRFKNISLGKITFVSMVMVLATYVLQDNLLALISFTIFAAAVIITFKIIIPLIFGISTSIVSNFKDLLNIFDRTKEKEQKGIRILVLNWRDTKHMWAGGAEVYAQELAKRWVRDGNSVTLFAGNDGKSKRNEKIDGVNIIRRGGFYTVYFWAFIYFISKFRGKYDVIIDTENGIPFFTPLYTRKKKFLLIHHVHQEVFRKSLRWPLSSIALFLEARLMPFVYRNVQVVTVSRSSKNEILKHKLTRKDPIVIYNGVDLDLYKPGVKSDKPLIVYLGRLQYYKSLHVFIVAAKRVLKKVPDAQFVIAGEGGEKGKLISFAKKLEVSDNVKFLGKVSEKAKIKLFQDAWVFVNPSFMEGWGITTIEANACATPAVASDVIGLKDSVLNTETGFLVKYHNYSGFTDSILTLISDKKLRGKMSKNAFLWSRNFSWDISAEKFMELIKVSLDEENEKAFSNDLISFQNN